MPRTKTPRKESDYRSREEAYLTYGSSRFKIEVLKNLGAIGGGLSGAGHIGYEFRILEIS